MLMWPYVYLEETFRVKKEKPQEKDYKISTDCT